jgi:ribosomal protein L5
MPNETERERDPFSALMFPSRRERIQESDKEENRDAVTEHEWLFGKRRSYQKEQPMKTNPKNQSALEKVVNNVNVPELINHLDTLMTSAQTLKPIIQQIKPVISSFLQTKK